MAASVYASQERNQSVLPYKIEYVQADNVAHKIAFNKVMDQLVLSWPKDSYLELEAFKEEDVIEALENEGYTANDNLTKNDDIVVKAATKLYERYLKGEFDIKQQKLKER